jgi:hypothetical protein
MLESPRVASAGRAEGCQEATVDLQNKALLQAVEADVDEGKSCVPVELEPVFNKDAHGVPMREKMGRIEGELAVR